MKKRSLNHFFPPTLLLGLSAFLSAVLGVLRDRLLASHFGASAGEGIYNLDVYNAAFKIPDFLFFVLISGAISSAFIPIFTQHKKAHQHKKAWEFASNMLHLMLVAVSFLALLAFIFAPQLTRLVAGGFDAELFDLTVHLVRIMLLSPIILTFSAVFMSLQDSFKAFFFRSLFPLFYNLGIILGILFFSDSYGVVGVAWGVIGGAVLGVLIQLPALPTIGYRHVWLFDVRKPDVQHSFKMMLPRLLSSGMYQLSQVAYTFIASHLVVGTITILYFANNLYLLPLSVVAVSFSITSFATLSELAMETDLKAFTSEMRDVMQRILFLILPATVGMILLRHLLVETLFLKGHFTVADALLTSKVLLVMLLSLFTLSLNQLLTRGFFARHDTKTPFYANVLGAFWGVIVAYLLSESYGAVGVAWGITTANVLTFLILHLLMQRQLAQPLLNYKNVLKMLLATALMATGVYLLVQFVPFPEFLWAKFLYLILVGFAGTLMYFFIAHLLNIPELKMLKSND